MTKAALGRRINALEQAQPAALPFALRRWFGEPLTDEQHRLADLEVEAGQRSVAPIDSCSMDADMVAWFSARGDRHAS